MGKNNFQNSPIFPKGGKNGEKPYLKVPKEFQTVSKRSWPQKGLKYHIVLVLFSFKEIVNFSQCIFLSHIINSVLNDNMLDNHSSNAHSRDLYVASTTSPEPRGSRIDCGPKLANLRRYWRDYYVVDNKKSSPTSSTISSEDTKVNLIFPLVF